MKNLLLNLNSFVQNFSIFVLHFKFLALPPLIVYGVLPSGIVVEPSPIRGLAADCPIH